MSTVTYKHQPGIHATRGAIPLAGTRHLYRVSKVLWPEEISNAIQERLVGSTLHVCSGRSTLGQVRVDLDPAVSPTVIADAACLPFGTASFDTVLCDPPYNGVFQWNHDLLEELSRVARRRIIFQHWFLMANPDGFYKKDHRFSLSDVLVWQPRTYFGRAQLISVYDRQQQ